MENQTSKYVYSMNQTILNYTRSSISTVSFDVIFFFEED